MTGQPGRHRLRRERNLANVFRGRAAAAADQAHTRGDEPPRIRRHVFRRAQVQVAALDVAWPAGVGLRRQPHVGHIADALDCLEHWRRADAAVDTDNARAARDQIRGKLLGRRAVQGGAIFFGSHLRDDRQVAHAAHRGDRGANLVQVAKSLEDEQVHLAVNQRLRLLAEHRFGFIDAGLAPRLDAHAKRADGAGHVGGLSRLLHRAPGERGAGEVDVAHLIAQAKAAQLHAVGAERIGLDDVGARLQVIAVNIHHQVGLRLVERLEAAVDEHTLRVQHRAHGAVAHKHTIIQRGKEGLHCR